MTSLQSAYAQIPSNKLYVNFLDARSNITDSNLSTQFLTGPVATALQTPGQCILRDMGKTIYLPSPSVSPVNGAGGISTVLRKVQLVPSSNAGSYGVGGGGSSNGVTDYFTGYIQIGALTYGGGNGLGAGGATTTVKFARLN
jgi:hypothetical protein